jgi:surface polysaccharide O-acyltransferase-like enzyme
MISNDNSLMIWRLKGIAIFTVLFAHLPAVYGPLQPVYHALAHCGVPTFFIIAGYFSYKSRSTIINKLKVLMLPLLIWGSFMFILPPSSGKFTESNYVLDYIHWMLGCDNWLYFVTILFWLHLIFRIKYADYFIPVLAVASMVLTEFGIIPYNDSLFTPWVNPFNFALYFFIGRMIRKRIDYDIKPVNGYLACASALLFLVCAILGNNKAYWTFFGFGLAISSFVLMVWLAFHLRYSLLAKIGSLSFVIYFIHQRFGAFIMNRVTFLDDTPLEVLKMFFIFAVIVLMAYALEWFLTLCKMDRLLPWLGFRKIRKTPKN